MYEKIIRWFGKTFLPKTKSFFKKYGGYIAAFFVGLLAAFGLNSARNKRARDHIRKLEAGIAEYARLNGELENIAIEFERRIAESSGDLESAVSENRLLRREITAARGEIDQLRNGLKSLGRSLDKGIDITDQLSEQSGRLTSGIETLGEFIAKYGAGVSYI